MASLVTGGSGYFGHVLVRKLRERGEQVAVFDLLDSTERPADVTYHRGDIRDLEAVRRACQGMEVVYHNVAQVPIAKDRAAFWSVNRDGTENTLRAAREAGARKVVYTSSSAVFGVPKRNPVGPDDEPHPMEAYGRAKFAGEQLCRAAVAQGFPVDIVRPRTIVGHGRLGIFQILFEWIREGRNVPVLGRGDNVYQFVHADDMAEAVLLAGQRHEPGVYNIGTDRYGSMRAVLEHLCRVAGTGSRVRRVPMWPAIAAMNLTSLLGLSPLGPYHALMYGRSMYFDISRAQAELGWQPRYSNEEMFEETYRWYVAHRDEVLSATAASHHRSPMRQGVLALLKYVL
ncbi:MAG TPA: NAD-dependent epimerase/dehydratase family protein [bacterium]|nr:NAD-dependent epimerase/dehydratase family protein [bacterium]